MEEITYNELIDNYLSEFEANMSVEDVVYKVVKDNLMNKKALRNKSIVEDFDIAFKKNNKKVITIYDDIAFKYNLSTEAIRKIVAFR